MLPLKGNETKRSRLERVRGFFVDGFNKRPFEERR